MNTPPSLLFAQVVQVGSEDNLLGDTVLNSKYFNPDYLFSQGVTFFSKLFGFTAENATEIISVIHFILSALALFFLTIISYSAIRMFEIRRKEHQHLKHEIAEYAHHQAEREKQAKQKDEISRNPKWAQTLSYLFSQHKSDWKLAVIEADSMLEELLNQMGFQGETLGDKLKGATQETFNGLSSAWEVHSIRNKIAHEGTAFELSQHEAKRVIALYEKIFRGYGFI